MSTLLVTHPRYTEHDFAGHPEHAGRIRSVWRLLDEAGLSQRMIRRDAAPIDRALLRTVHTADYLDLVASTAGQHRRLDSDTYIVPSSHEIALLSAGGMVDAVRGVLDGDALNAIAITRPPGHHAMPDRAMGFCIYGNIAAAARFAQQAYGLKRVLIVDYDVHHGNGTEAMFYDDPSVLFVSLHQYPLYPGSGWITDTGSGKGEGYNVNVPLAPGNGDANYAAVFENVLWPLAQRFAPELILVSVGHDAHWSDPLASMRLTLSGYAHLAREMLLMAQELCGGRIVYLMEGGYDLDALGYGWRNIARILLGDATDDPMGAHSHARPEPDVTPLIEALQRLHRLT